MAVSSFVRGADGVVEVWGPAGRPRRVPLERGAAYDGVRIRAGAGPAVLGVPAADLAGLARPDARIAQVATELGIGERQLRRRFERVVGLSPSAYRRLVRTRSALRDPSRPRPSPSDTIAAVAHRRGFTDQSHLSRWRP